MRTTHVFGGIPTADFAAAAVWYERLLGRPPDNRPHAGEAVWQLTDSGLMYLVDDAERAGHGLLTLIVDDLDAQIAELHERGIETGAIETIPNAARKLTVTDPDGNSVSFGEVLGRSA